MTKDEIKGLLYNLHHSTFRNEKQIQNSKVCGCFHCQKIFLPESVNEWCDNDGRGDKTALCPHCGMDSVLGDAGGVDITPSIMFIMNKMFFGDGIDDLNINVNDNSSE